METATLDDHIEGHKTPPLVAIKEINLRHTSETPPPASRDSSAIPSDEDDSKSDGDDPGGQGDWVLLSQLAPNNLDAANDALKHRLPVIEKNPTPMSIDHPPPRSNTPGNDHDAHQQALPKHEADGDFVQTVIHAERPRKESLERIICRDTASFSLDDVGPPSPNTEKKSQWNFKPPPLRQASRESLATSPVAQFTIDGRDADPNTTLAALHTTSPPRPAVGSPDGRQTLPSLTTALGDAGSPYSASSPHLSRSASSSQFGGPLSSIASARSPPNYSSNYSSNPQFWRTSRERANSTSTPSDYAVSTPHSAWTAQSPATSLPTPLSSTSSAPSAIPSHPLPSSTTITATSNTANGTHAPQTHHPSSEHSANSSISSATAAINGIFRCHVPGCTAAPFQTQYLLNSHANVHSDTRPHFCPVKNCPRGPGGQGFKRKNEMIR